MGDETMVYRLRTGDILLANHGESNQTFMYLLVHDSNVGYAIYCLSCGDMVCFFKDDKKELEDEIRTFFDVKGVIPKEVMAEIINKKYVFENPVNPHDIFDEEELGIEIELPIIKER